MPESAKDPPCRTNCGGGLTCCGTPRGRRSRGVRRVAARRRPKIRQASAKTVQTMLMATHIVSAMVGLIRSWSRAALTTAMIERVGCLDP
jgi:hypothetical protein